MTSQLQVPRAQDPRAEPRRPASTGILLLAAAGSTLVIAGALLSWRFGPAVHISDTILIALSWCF